MFQKKLILLLYDNGEISTTILLKQGRRQGRDLNPPQWSDLGWVSNALPPKRTNTGIPSSL